MKAPVPNCITETFNSGEPITPEGRVIFVLMLCFENTHWCTDTCFLSLTFTPTHFSPSQISEPVVHSCRGKLLLEAGMIKHLSGSERASSQKHPHHSMLRISWRVHLSSLAMCCLSFHSSSKDVVEEGYRRLLGITLKPRSMCFKSSVVLSASWILL